MEKKIFTSRVIALSSLILIAAFSRLIPHMPNFTPVLAIALLGGANFSSKKLAFIVPIAAMLLSDLFIGFHSTMFVVYAGFATTVLMGMAIRNKQSVLNIGAATLASSLLFFVITNFGVWITTNLYAHTLQGLTACYISAIPFFGNSLTGDIFYSALLFGSFNLVALKFPVPAKS